MKLYLIAENSAQVADVLAGERRETVFIHDRRVAEVRASKLGLNLYMIDLSKADVLEVEPREMIQVTLDVTFSYVKNFLAKDEDEARESMADWADDEGVMYPSARKVSCVISSDLRVGEWAGDRSWPVATQSKEDQ